MDDKSILALPDTSFISLPLITSLKLFLAIRMEGPSGILYDVKIFYFSKCMIKENSLFYRGSNASLNGSILITAAKH